MVIIMKSKTAIVSIVLLSIIALSLTGLFIFLLTNGKNFSFDFSFDFNSKPLSLVDSYETDPNIRLITLNLHSTDVFVKESTNEKILVEYYSNRENNARIEYTEDTIKINEEDYDLSCIGFCNSRRKVVVYVPSIYEGEYNIATKSGDITSEIDMSNSKVNVSAMSGDVKLNVTSNINVSTMSGDIRIEATNDINASAMSGDMEIGSISKYAKLKTMSGDVHIRNLNIEEDSFIDTSSGDVKVDNNDSNCYIETKTSSGDTRINSSDRKSDITLKVTTSSGDISVN